MRRLAEEVAAKVEAQQELYDREGWNFGDWDGMTESEMDVFGIRADRLAPCVIA